MTDQPVKKRTLKTRKQQRDEAAKRGDSKKPKAEVKRNDNTDNS